MNSIRTLKLQTDCLSCRDKCCNQPYDWVYLIAQEVDDLVAASGLEPDAFMSEAINRFTGHRFKTLTLPCAFLDPNTGMCNVYSARPLICKLFPFYLEPLTATASLLAPQCGDSLKIVPHTSEDGWSLQQLEEQAECWLGQLWKEALNGHSPLAPGQSDLRTRR